MSSDDRDDEVPGDFPKEHMWPWDPNDFMNIDQYMDAVGTTTVRKVVGSPTFRPVEEIPESELEGEVGRILDLLLEHSIEVDLEECAPAEAYRFLTTDIMDSEIEDPPAPGWSHVFLYGLMHATARKKNAELGTRNSEL